MVAAHRGRFGSSALARLIPILILLVSAGASVANAQAIRVDTTPSHAIQFDPDKALGTSIDILPAVNFDEVYTAPNLKESLSAGWGPISYRQNTELTIEAWHWNPNGTWSDPAHRDGYFTGSAQPGAEPLRESFGYSLPHRGTTRRRRRQRILAPHRRRRIHLLEKQPVSRAEVHRRGRRPSAAMDRHRLRHAAANRRHPNRLGESLRNAIRRRLLVRRRCHGEASRGLLDRFPHGRRPEREGRHGHAAALGDSGRHALRSHPDDAILEHV